VAYHRQLGRIAAIHCRILSFTGYGFLILDQPMGKTIFITGGARSGKSGIAETMTLALGPHAVYIATAEAGDDEMARRIADHQARRGAEWTTCAEPVDLVAALNATDGQGPRLVDCLTLWLSNLMLANRDWRDAAQELVAALKVQNDPVVIVSNELGSGIVPENKLARDFRDAAGLINQRVAAGADEVWLAVAGLPLKVK
jgi:adenosylcobinamide kinase/adenosylcobinamide-phosphate guanylyltransferase